MANYNSIFKTNLFKVKDEEKFKELIRGLSGEDIYTETNNGEFFVGGYCCPDYYPPASESSSADKIVELAKAGQLFDQDNNAVPLDGIDNYDTLYDASGDVVYDKFDEYGDMDIFYLKLQELLPENEVFILTQIGWEKLRYVDGFVSIVTSKDISFMSLEQYASDYVKHNLKVTQ